MIENDLITWEQYDFKTNSTFYQTYSITEGKLIDSQSAIKPLTELVLGNYDNNAVILVENDDRTWTLYQSLRNNENAESLSVSLVTMDESGNTNVSYQGSKGYICLLYTSRCV